MTEPEEGGAWRQSVNLEEAESVLRHGAAKVTAEDVDRVIRDSDEIRKKFSGAEPLKQFLGDLKMIFKLIVDYASGRYRAVPFYTIAAVVAALLYALNPMDLIPDFIPGVGYLDDAAVMAACLGLVRKDVRRYREWLDASTSG